jgi:hypothetical protein
MTRAFNTTPAFRATSFRRVVLAGILLSACAGDDVTAPVSSLAPSESPSRALLYCSSTRLLAADLVPGYLGKSGVAVRATDGTNDWLVPVLVAVKNDGYGCAGRFRIEAHRLRGEIYSIASMVVDETSDIDANGMTKGTLQPDSVINFHARIRVPGTTSITALRVRLDVCNAPGEEIFGSACRVAEFNEANNWGEWITVTLP